MKCPICGCKMKEEFMCPFCKITGDQVRNASNKEAIKKIKNKDTEEVYNSSYLPKDVNNMRLFIKALLGGYLGIHQMSVGKYKTGWFYLCLTAFAIITYILSRYLFPTNLILDAFMKIGFVFGAVVIFCWISDCFKILFKSFSIPVVLAEAEYKNKEKKK